MTLIGERELECVCGRFIVSKQYTRVGSGRRQIAIKFVMGLCSRGCDISKVYSDAGLLLTLSEAVSGLPLEELSGALTPGSSLFTDDKNSATRDASL